MSGPSARAWSFMLAAVFAAAIASDLWRMPVQVYDAAGEILDAKRSASVTASFTDSLQSAAYLRPLRIAQIKALFDASHGHYHLAYRGFHAALMVALVWLFASALRVESGIDLTAAAFSLTVLTGLHTFLGFAREAFPINHFLEVAVIGLAVLNLAQSRGGWWADLLAALLFAVAALTLESGLLVWVVAVAAWVFGMRGISLRGGLLMTALLVAYGILRFDFLATGVPTLAERSSGFLLERLEPDELQRRFGQMPLVFYAYNVAASVLSVLFSEPRDGLFVAARSWRDGDVPPRVYVALISSAATTALLAWWALDRWRRREPFAAADRLALVAGAVLPANAVLSFAYTKDEIVAFAGVFYALAAFAAMRALLRRLGAERRAVPVVAISILLLGLGSLWSIRSLAVHHVLSRAAFRVRNDWVEAPRFLRKEHHWPRDQGEVALVDALRQQALDTPVRNPQLVGEWNNRWLGD